MSGISIHQNGKPYAKMRYGLEEHLFRENEEEAKHVLENTKSYIDVSQTQYNQTLYVNENEVDYDENGKIIFAQKLRDEFKEMNVKRKSEGLRAKQKNSFVGTVDTLQLSDEALEAMGYEKFYTDRFDKDEQGRDIAVRKPWSEQTEEARRLVIQAYSAMIEATNDRPDLYGHTVVAQLHVDESIPHVERVSRMIDKDDYDFNSGNIINGNHLGKGQRGRKRGEARQDHFAEKTREILGEEFSNRYGIKRGEKGSAKTDKLKDLSLYEQAIKIKADKFAEQQHALEMQRLALIQRENALEQREGELTQREGALRGSESRLNDLRDDLDRREKKVAESENRASESLDKVKHEFDTYYNAMNAWLKKGQDFASEIEAKIKAFDNAEVLPGQDKKYLDIALGYCSIKMKGGTVMRFSDFVKNDKAKEKKRLTLDMQNATDLYSSKMPGKPSVENDLGIDY